MAYTVLNESLQVKGKLTLNNGQGSTAFFADTITQQIATDNSSDPANSTAMAFNEYDKQGNAKQWGHSITVSVEATDLGASISTNDYLMYFDDVNNHYYLMKVITAETDRNSGFVTISGINTAIYELGKQIVNDETTFKQANLQAVVNGLYKNAPFSVVIQDDLATVIDYTVSANTSLQAVLQDLQTKYNVDVDSWIELDESGNISDRIIYFGHIGRDNGELIRYGGAKGFENINAQELSDTIYTKLYVTGLTDDKNPTKGHIGSVNNGMEYILDDDANAKQYAIGASQQQPVYLEGSITNTLLSEPQALLTWAKAQMGIFNHPRFNYTVTPLHDQIVGIGDTIAVQDFHIKPEILVTSKVIQKSTSFSSPETNTFVLGEFSSIFTENANKGAGVIQLIKKDVTVVQEAADYAKAQADEAHRQAVTAQEQAIHAQTSADGKTTTYTVDSVQDLPGNAVEGDIGWVKLSDGTHMYSYTDGKWVEKINPSMGADINKKVSDAVTQAKAHTATAIEQNNASQQAVMDDIAKSQADLAIKDGDFNNKAQAMADRALSDAKANTTQATQEALNSANQNIADAKKSLTDGISKEASDRASAVAAANSQAQTYANQAKADALNTIAKEVTDRASAVNALDTKAQGYANTAKTDALNALTKEVTNRQNAVSALDTKATNAVNQAKSDINDTINSLSVGGRNLILDTARSISGVGLNRPNLDFMNPQVGTYYLAGGKKVSDLYNQYGPSGYLTISFDWVASGDTISGSFNAMWNQSPWSGLSTIGSIKPSITNKSGHYISTVQLNFSGFDYSTGNATGVKFRQDNLQGNVTISNVKLEAGNKATDWTPAPEDVVLDYTTKDNQIKETISQYQETNNGKVSKVQTDATTALGQVATKVSQTDYDKKTGDLATKYTQVKQTADSQATDIVDIKKTATSQASKINTISSDVDGTKQSISDIETTQDSQSDKINQITSDVNGTKQSITDIQTKDGKQDTRMGTIETSVSGVKSDFSTYKTDTNSHISTAQTTAQTAVDGLKTKVSQTDYNTKTGQLQTDLTTTTQTANKAKTDIVSINQKDDKQDSRMNTIESDASGTKQTVSDIQTKQGKQSGYISKLQQRADGFDATVTKVNNLSVGGTNLVSGTNQEYQMGYGIPKTTWQDGYAYLKLPTNVINGEILPQSSHTFSYTLVQGTTYTQTIWLETNATVKDLSVAQITWYTSAGYDIQPAIIQKLGQNSYKIVSTYTWPGKTDNNVRLFDIEHLDSAFDLSTGTYLKFGKLKLETGNMSTDWTPAPEDLSSATAKAQLTADNASVNLSNYQTDADGRISRAQSGVDANTKSITAKVSQTDYDKKTGDLTTAVSKAQTTADGVVSTVGNYKTSNDGRVKAAESKIEQNSKDITARVSKTDYDNNNSQLNTRFTKVEATADGASTTVGELSAAVNNLSQANLINNSDFSPDLAGWTSRGAGNFTTGDYDYSGGVYVVESTSNLTRTNSAPIPLNGVTAQLAYSLSFNSYIFNLPSGGRVAAQLTFLDVNFNETSSSYPGFTELTSNGTGKWVNTTLNNIIFTPPTGAMYVVFSFDSRGAGTKAGFNRPILVKGSSVGSYVRGQYNNNTKIASQQITIDGLTDTVSDPKTGLSRRVQTAEGFLTQVRGTDIPALQNATFWQPYSSLNFNDYTKQGSFFFNTTAAKTNGPTTSGSWLYLIVEQGTADNSRIKQTAWYDGVTGVKITYVRTLNSGTWSSWYANDNDSVTTISQTNSDVRQEISDRKTGDSNTLQSSKDFTQSTITSAVKGVNSTITQTSKSLIAKINTKTGSDTVLSLLKDNWSIGIADNVSKITSGIVGNSSSMSLISKNIVLDGNTTVTGDFYAKGGNFKNLNASNIKVGTLDGYQVNITNINVNNLVGDTITGFNINANKLLYIAPGGQLKSDTLLANSDSFKFIGKGGVTSHYTSSYGTDIYIENVGFTIDSTYAEMSSSGKINTSRGNNNNATGSMQTLYSPGHTYMHSSNWTDSDPDHHALLIDTGLTIADGSININKSSSYSQITAKGITTSGRLNAFGETQTPRIYSYPDLILESMHKSVILKAGNKKMIQVRENGYIYLGNVKWTSGGTSVQMATDGALTALSSSIKYKTNIEYDKDGAAGEKLLTLDPMTWQDKSDDEEIKKYKETGIKPDHKIDLSNRRYYGMLAEDFDKAGLDDFVLKDEETGELHGIQYEKIGAALIPIIRNMRKMILEQQVEIERLKEK